MKNNTTAAEFVDTEKALAWTPIVGLPKGAWEKILYKDEESGTYARLVKLEKGFENQSGEQLVHPFDELVFMVAGETTFPKLGQSYTTGFLGLFPQGAKHGPYCAPNGSLAIEFRHYPKLLAGKRSFPTLAKKNTTGAEFVNAEVALEWTQIAGLPEGAREMILYRDEESGTYARLVKLEKGFENLKGEQLVHPFDELVFMVAGETTFPKLGQSYTAGFLGLFPEGMKHGPYCAPGGSLAIEFRHYPRSLAGRRSFPTLKS